jgi:membrane-associated phospholipid phosphatase
MRRSDVDLDNLVASDERRELGIFVPALMSAGLVFSIVSLLQDAMHSRRWRAHHRRASLATMTLAEQLRTGRKPVAALTQCVLPRRQYVCSGALSLVAAAALAYGATANYFRDGGYLSDVAWLWAMAMLAAMLFAIAGLTAMAIAIRWPVPPPWTLGILVRGPLSHVPTASAEDKARNRLGLMWGATSMLLFILAVVVATVPRVLAGTDERFANIVAEWDVPDLVRTLAHLRHAGIVLVVAVAAIALGRRCTVYIVTYLGAVAITFGAAFLIETAVSREQPLGVFITGRTTFPSTEIAQAIVISLLVPIAIRLITHRRLIAAAVSAGLVAIAVAIAIVDVHDRHAWPTDVVGGALLGLGVVFAAGWVLWHPTWHANCGDCWWAEPTSERRPGLFVMSEEWSCGLQRVAISCTFIMVGVLVALALTRGIPEDPDGGALGTQITQPTQIALLVVMAAGAALAFRWSAVGATVIALAGLLLAVLSASENPPAVATVISLGALIPAAVLWLTWQRSATRRRIWIVALTATSLVTLGFFGAANVYAQYFGPTHPASTLPLRRVDGVEWAWSGGVTPTRVTVVARVDFGSHRARVDLRPMTGGAVVTTRAVRVPGDRIVRLTANGLQPDTQYAWRVVVDGKPDAARGLGTLRTAGAQAESFTVVAGSCIITGSDGKVFEAMRAVSPDLVLFTGDLHYQNIDANDVNAFHDAYDRVLTQPAPAALLRSAAAAYLWDDHDYGPNDADATSPSRPAARAAYRESVPYAHLSPVGPPAQAFTIGRVRFIMTDERSHRTATSMLGPRQLDWFLHELTQSSRTHQLVVWVNSVPWIERASTTADGWGRYPNERRQIADAISTAGIHNLVMVAGDAHMLAIDDGSHSDYSTYGGAGFPVFHAGALDRPGSVKGGPYSEGTYPGGGQFGVLRVHDSGTHLSVTLEGRNWKGERIVALRFAPHPVVTDG